MLTILIALAIALGFFLGVLVSAVTTIDERIAVHIVKKATKANDAIQGAAGSVADATQTMKDNANV